MNKERLEISDELNLPEKVRPFTLNDLEPYITDCRSGEREGGWGTVRRVAWVLNPAEVEEHLGLFVSFSFFHEWLAYEKIIIQNNLQWYWNLRLVYPHETQEAIRTAESLYPEIRYLLELAGFSQESISLAVTGSPTVGAYVKSGRLIWPNTGRVKDYQSDIDIVATVTGLLSTTDQLKFFIRHEIPRNVESSWCQNCRPLAEKMAVNNVSLIAVHRINEESPAVTQTSLSARLEKITGIYEE